MKHNNAVPVAHFHKDWQRFVKTWFNQPARAHRRKVARQDKAARVAPRPVKSLKPIVRCPTIKYNKHVREGRGFTVNELKEAGIHPKQARGIGITFDRRRKNRSEEGKKVNVDRLKAYLSKLVIIPTTKAQKAALKTKGKTIEKAADYKQVDLAAVLPVREQETALEVRKITEEDRKHSAFTKLHRARLHEKHWSSREIRKKKKAAGDAAGAKKAAKAGGGDDADD